MAKLSEHDTDQIQEANASDRVPVVFVPGLWLLPSSWDRWRTMFEGAGYATLAPGWPEDAETVAAANGRSDASAGTTIGQIADHFEDVIRKLSAKPAVVGHSFGGLLAEIVAGRGLASASVAIAPAPFRGVLPLPVSALRSAAPAVQHVSNDAPANHDRAVPLTFDQFRHAFANAVDEQEARDLFESFVVPGSGTPVFPAADANLDPWTGAKVQSKRPDRGPMLIIAAASDHTVPTAIADASFRKQRRNAGVTEIVTMPGRGHSLTIDSGWPEVADATLGFVRRYAQP
jgi:pimeloyl-ACP methyl ester carboxylesterase